MDESETVRRVASSRLGSDELTDSGFLSSKEVSADGGVDMSYLNKDVFLIKGVSLISLALLELEAGAE